MSGERASRRKVLGADDDRHRNAAGTREDREHQDQGER